MFTPALRHRYVRTVRRLLKATFCLSGRQVTRQDRIWKEWLALNKRAYLDLQELLSANVNDAFKARALTMLLIPDLELAPFAWENPPALKTYLFLPLEIDFSRFSPPLQRFATSLLETNIETVLASGTDGERGELLSFYNPLILQALAILNENDSQAARLFGCYQFDEERVDCSPFRRLLASAIPEEWKWRADQQAHRAILAESGTHRVLDRYILDIYLLGRDPSYGAALLAAQITFLLNLPDPAHLRFDSSYVVSTLERLSGAKWKVLRHCFVRQTVLPDRGACHRFRVYNESTLRGARAMHREFGRDDPELRTRLREIIMEGRKRLRQERAAANARQKRIDYVFALMQ